STLAYALAGHPKYTITAGEALLDGKNLLAMSPANVPGPDCSSGSSTPSRSPGSP
ncbi:hypothetical protein B1B_03596, partial [mine drainage metagenome]